MKADYETETAVIATVRKWLEAYESRDLDALLKLFIPDSDVIVIGTGADEKRVGAAEIKLQIERDYAQAEAISAEIGWYLVSTTGDVAWIAAECVFVISMGEKEVNLPTRITVVLERRSRGWLIAQWHVSTPAAGQTEGESWTTPS